MATALTSMWSALRSWFPSRPATGLLSS